MFLEASEIFLNNFSDKDEVEKIVVNKNQQILEEVSRANIQLLLREPFYAHLLSCLSKKVLTGEHRLKSLGLSLEGTAFILNISEAYLRTELIDPMHRYGALKHETLHLIFKHPLKKIGQKDRRLAYIAMDLVVNQYISKDHLPEGALKLESFPELNLPANQSWEYYYRQLEGLSKENTESESSQNLESITLSSHGLDRHQLWPILQKSSELALDIALGNLENLLLFNYKRTPVKSIDSLPHQLQLHLENLQSPPQTNVDWRRLLRIFTASTGKTNLKNTIKRASKRYGTVPGIRIKRNKRLLIALDTSASVAREDLEDFFREVRFLWRRGVQIYLAECDTEIHQLYEYDGKMPNFVKGRGGTNFTAPIRHANEVLIPDGLVYLTDGLGPPPDIRSRVPLLWVISRKGISPGEEGWRRLPGRKVRLKGLTALFV